ncbi:hypothetical protein EYF80_006672 [Liparis tanakae]|uniref:Uncharacterized protein n=1 Tax=Liparis tanakae TaxID=230148 RepID=A0A4Z2IYK1_9TELE|nr:hypothetical protein EYF80_006672 [Liparis tanakae]
MGPPPLNSPLPREPPPTTFHPATKLPGLVFLRATAASRGPSPVPEAHPNPNWQDVGSHDEVLRVNETVLVGVLLPACVIALVGDVALASPRLKLPEVQPCLVVLGKGDMHFEMRNRTVAFLKQGGSLLFSLDRIISSMSPCSFSMTTNTRSGVSNMHSRFTIPG